MKLRLSLRVAQNSRQASKLDSGTHSPLIKSFTGKSVPQYIWKVLYPDSDVHWLPLDPGQPPRRAFEEGLGWLAVPVCVAVIRWVVAVLVPEAGWRMVGGAVVEGELSETEIVVVVTLFIDYISYFLKE